jgi:hypothetical protein
LKLKKIERYTPKIDIFFKVYILYFKSDKMSGVISKVF